MKNKIFICICFAVCNPNTYIFNLQSKICVCSNHIISHWHLSMPLYPQWNYGSISIYYNFFHIVKGSENWYAVLWKTSFGFIWDILNFLKICKSWVWAQIRSSKLLLNNDDLFPMIKVRYVSQPVCIHATSSKSNQIYIFVPSLHYI